MASPILYTNFDTRADKPPPPLCPLPKYIFPFFIFGIPRPSRLGRRFNLYLRLIEIDAVCRVRKAIMLLTYIIYNFQNIYHQLIYYRC